MNRQLALFTTAAVFLLGTPSTLRAHFQLLEPASWLVENKLGDPQKAGPCGVDAKTPGTPTNIIGKAVGGSKLKLRVLKRSITRVTIGSRWR